MRVLFRVALSAALSLLAVGDALADTAPDVTGLWKSVHEFGPDVSGQLTIRKTTKGMTATIGSHSSTIIIDKFALSFALPDGQGKFRGTLNGASIAGFWIQPATATFGVEHASPVSFHRTGNGRWSGDIVPLKDRLTLYLEIDRQADGSLGGFIRNPELNYGRGRALTIAVTGDQVSVTDPARHQTNMQGHFDTATQKLTLTAAPVNIDFTFARIDPAHAVGFAPRLPVTPYIYRSPALQDDGWKTGSLADAGIDEAAISALVQRIADTKPAAGATPYIDSLLIARHGRLVLEEYFDGFDSETPHALRSASKSVTSMLLGAAIDHGAPVTVDTPVASEFAQYQPFANPDPRKSHITVENLLTMSSGLACDDDDDNSPGNEDNMQNQSTQPDWYKYTLDLPMAHAPGEKAVYCSAGVNLVGGVIRKATGRWVPELFEDYLAAPLQIHRYYMNLMPTGEAYGGGGIYIRPRDALKFGQLYLDGGIWNGRRVISAAWIKASTSTHAKIHDDSTYGYNWWLYTLNVGVKSYDEWEMGGNGGQIIAVIPALDMVVEFTGSNYGRFDIWSKFQGDLIPNVIVPAAH